MRSLSTLATLLLGLAVVFWAPVAKAHCPHGGDTIPEHCGGDPGDPAPSTSNEFRFVGFTAGTIAGDQGMIAMHALCQDQDDFGPDSRMCTSEEFWLSPNAKAPTADAWLHNVNPAIFDFSGYNQNQGVRVVADPLGVGLVVSGIF